MPIKTQKKKVAEIGAMNTVFRMMQQDFTPISTIVTHAMNRVIV